MEAFVPFVAASALIYGLYNMLKNAQGGEWTSVVTQLGSWVIGVAVIALLAGTDFAGSIQVGDSWSLDTLGWQSLVLVGVSTASATNFAYDLSPLSTPSLGSSSGTPSD